MAKKKIQTKKKAPPKKQPSPSTPLAEAQSTESNQPVVPYPAAGKKVVEFEQRLDEQIETAAAATKRGPGRPRKDTQPTPLFAMDIGLIAGGVKLPFDLWALNQKINELKLTDTEAVAIAAPIKQLLNYYLPNIPEIGIAWFSLCVSTYSIMSVRLAILAELRKKTPSSSSESAAVDGPEQSGPVQRPQSPQPGETIKFPGPTKPVKV